MSANKKKVLFISPAFFGYEKAITNAIEKNGFEVDFFDERLSNNSFLKAIFRVRKDLLRSSIRRYYSLILTIIKANKYDYFLLIKGEIIPEFFINKIREFNQSAVFVYYTFDAVKNNPNSLTILKYFDKCFSFDFSDVEKYPNFKLKHLFFSNEFLLNEQEEINKVYDISFVGTLHSNRYELISKVFKDFDKKFLFLFFTAKWLFLINKVFRKDYYKISWNEVSFEKINKNEVAKIFKNSKAVLDIQRNHQSGLTMRTFEVLASGSILITFNKNITKTNFYNSDRIFVINEDIPPSEVEILKEKIQKQNLAHNESIPSQYFLENHYLENWVKEFFS